MPGSFDAEQIFEKLMLDKAKSRQNKNAKPTNKEPFIISNWRLGQFEIGQCTTNCSFQIQDLKQLIKRHEFVAHKFELDKEPATYFCIVHMIRSRAMNQKEQLSFEGNKYKKSPQIRLSRGETIDNIDFVFD